MRPSLQLIQKIANDNNLRIYPHIIIKVLNKLYKDLSVQKIII